MTLKLNTGLSLISTGRKGVSPTDKEKNIIKEIALCVLIAAEQADSALEETLSETVIQTFTEVTTKGDYKDAPSLMRKMHRHIESQFVKKDEESSDPTNWPKVRDWQAITNMFRKAIEALDIEAVTAQLDSMFKKYTPAGKSA